MRPSGWVPVALLVGGGALVVDAVVRGAASVALVAIIPVVSGASIEFLAGVVLLLAGFLTLPLAFLSVDEPLDPATSPEQRAHGMAPTEEVGGLLLVGPVPIFFGSWKNVSGRTKFAAAAVGAVLLIVLVVALVVALR
ncbi:MAG TPA: DUF131 domain-containing protein [Thermoplasmata archaeon]|nr:DUF131 domain-containing protein [Thermoplasmata archaeon]